MSDRRPEPLNGLGLRGLAGDYISAFKRLQEKTKALQKAQTDVEEAEANLAKVRHELGEQAILRKRDLNIQLTGGTEAPALLRAVFHSWGAPKAEEVHISIEHLDGLPR